MLPAYVDIFTTVIPAQAEIHVIDISDEKILAILIWLCVFTHKSHQQAKFCNRVEKYQPATAKPPAC